MKNRIFLTTLCASLLCALSLAQTTPAPNAAQPSPAGTSQTQQQTPSQPQPMQPGTPPPTEPQPNATSQPTPSQNAAGAAPAAVHRIAPGSVLPVQLAKSVDAKKAKTGDEVVATVTQDMKSSSGDVVVPKDTQVIGHVTESQARSKEQKESVLGIAFDHAVVKGDPMQMPMSIQAVIGQQTNNPNSAPNNDQSSPATAGAAPATGSAPSSPMGGHGGSQTPTPPPQSNAPQPGSSDSTQSQQQANARPPINGQTQGVIGISNLTLASNGQNAAQGSVLTSEKNNVKIDKGTMLLLRVNQ
jgi:hypothetical protein